MKKKEKDNKGKFDKAEAVIEVVKNVGKGVATVAGVCLTVGLYLFKKTKKF